MPNENAPVEADTASAPTTPADQNPTPPTPTEQPAQGEPTEPAAPAESSDPRGQNIPEPTGEADPDFSVPESYKEKPWASKVSSSEDLWKMADNLQTMVGRKNVAPDFETATPQELESYLAQTRPESPDAYKFDSAEDYQPSGLEDGFAEAFHKNGVHPAIGNQLIQDLQGVLNTASAEAYDPDKFLSSMEESFGNGYEMKTNQARQIIESNQNDADKKSMETMSNEHLALMYRLTNNLNQAYGINESGLNGEHGTGAITPDAGEVKAAIRKEIAELNSRPHTDAEKQVLIDKLYDATASAIKTNKR